jgi:hypothetical protein
LESIFLKTLDLIEMDKLRNIFITEFTARENPTSPTTVPLILLLTKMLLRKSIKKLIIKCSKIQLDLEKSTKEKDKIQTVGIWECKRRIDPFS